MLHQWEEPGISVGNGSGAVFFAGCSLKCVYCQNQAISRTVTGSALTPEGLSDLFLRFQEQGAANVNLVTPTHFAIPIRKAIAYSRSHGLALPVIWNTSGYENASAIRANAGYVDVYLTDFKYASSVLAQELSLAREYPSVALASIHEMLRCTDPWATDVFAGEERLVSGCIVRHLVLPGYADESCHALELLWNEFGNGIKLSLMSQYTPLLRDGDPALIGHPSLARAVLPEEYEQVLCFADDLGFEDYFWQEGETAADSFIPAFGRTIES